MDCRWSRGGHLRWIGLACLLELHALGEPAPALFVHLGGGQLEAAAAVYRRLNTRRLATPTA